LLELAVVLSILGVLVGLAYPSLRRGLDGIAARGARDALGMGVARARAAAVARGGAALIVDIQGARFWVEAAAGDTVGRPVDIGKRYGVRLALEGAPAERVALRFDGLGIGRVTNRTFQVRRGRAEAHLTLSAYGRPRVW
jgi:type II secretory pathway pseudopilin PulG